jgi:hypothetical protein
MHVDCLGEDILQLLVCHLYFPIFLRVVWRIFYVVYLVHLHDMFNEVRGQLWSLICDYFPWKSKS